MKGKTGQQSNKSGCCTGGRPERFIEPCILLLLAESEDHGYTLMERLSRYGFDSDSPDPGTTYRLLRRLEKEGMITSGWEEGPSGPAKRVYRITEEGLRLLDEWMKILKRNIARINILLDDYAQRFDGERFTGEKSV